MVFLTASSAKLVVDALNAIHQEVVAAKGVINVEETEGTFPPNLIRSGSFAMKFSSGTDSAFLQFQPSSLTLSINTMPSWSLQEMPRRSGLSPTDKQLHGHFKMSVSTLTQACLPANPNISTPENSAHSKLNCDQEQLEKELSQRSKLF